MIKISSDDALLITNVLNEIPALATEQAAIVAASYPDAKDAITRLDFDHPFDESVCAILRTEILPLDDSEQLYTKIDTIKSLWFVLVEKSIKCLRYFDKREPYLVRSGKKPQAYGLDGLKKYYDEFAGFESLLYSSNQFYRDHVIHLFRTWLIGFNILIYESGAERVYSQLSIEGDADKAFEMNFFESVSLWTVAALCHDLGYPLEKFKSILNKTKKMMEFLVSNPSIDQDITFSGTQDQVNEYILRMISSKMKIAASADPNLPYLLRTQAKYFIKYSKSLEDYSHGVISSIIVYKALLYFLESDFSTHDDHTFSLEDARQFCIRRDILRSIASHTCRDIYHMNATSFPLLLIICDDLQEWGRRKWSDLYSRSSSSSVEFSLVDYNRSLISVEYRFELTNSHDVSLHIKSFYKQFEKFRLLLRDGQDTVGRSFNLYFRYAISLTDKSINVTMFVPSDNAAVFKIQGEHFVDVSEFDSIVRSGLTACAINKTSEYGCVVS